VTPEIRAFEFSLGLFSVLIGLAVADVATSFHRLVRHQAKVQWDALTLLAALFALVISVGMWFDLWGIRHATSVRHFFFYLVLVGAFFILFLIAAASLPDELSGSADLRAYYSGNRRYFWTLVTLFEFLYVILGCYFLSTVIDRIPRHLVIETVVQWAALVLIPLALAVLKPRWIHYAGLLLLFGVTFWHYASYSIN
jgi:hypothetical protein